MTVLLVVVWVVSGWVLVGWIGRLGYAVGIGEGTVSVTHWPSRETSETHFGWGAETGPFEFYLWFRTFRSGRMWVYAAPLWLLAGLVLIVTARAWRLDALARRRALLNLCAICRYDRTGLPPGASCPECGSPVAPVNP